MKEGMERKKIELSLFSDDITVCTGQQKRSMSKLLEIISKFSKSQMHTLVFLE